MNIKDNFLDSLTRTPQRNVTTVGFLNRQLH